MRLEAERAAPGAYLDEGYRSICLEPASPAVPAATEKDHHEDDNDQKRRVVHRVSLWPNASTDGAHRHVLIPRLEGGVEVAFDTRVLDRPLCGAVGSSFYARSLHRRNRNSSG